MRKITKRTAAVVAASALAIGGAGAAWAAWTLTGTGSTSAKAASVQQLTIGSVEVVGLSPGNKSDVKFVAKNPNSFPVQITGIDITSIGGAQGCPASNVTKQAFVLPAPADLRVGAAVGATSGEKAITLPNAILMDLSAGDGCVGAVFAVNLKLDALSAAAA